MTEPTPAVLEPSGLDQEQPTETEAPEMLEISVNSASEVDTALEEAIEHVKVAANNHRTGILVTRIRPGGYIVQAHSAVPHGLVRQRNDPEGN
ncbi:hypothetical protein [Arthrobacter sp. B6]|uniref:hypothetical protein n=1 Tax=Arthrobacter sp. B6 TaxID=1570137 RepID=UPI0012E80C7B|nr:hypothetical protein [Arthrobacter sp. B6]